MILDPNRSVEYELFRSLFTSSSVIHLSPEQIENRAEQAVGAALIAAAKLHEFRITKIVPSENEPPSAATPSAQAVSSTARVTELLRHGSPLASVMDSNRGLGDDPETEASHLP